MSVSNNKTSLLISSQVPQFVKDDHETFVVFLEEYYKFLEQENQVQNELKNFQRNKDIDNAEGIYLEKLYDNFISLLPENVLADRTLILKHVKDFYRARGSEKSVRFLMRILFNKDVEFYYPKRDVLRASDGKWFVEKSVRVGDIRVNNTSNTIAYTNFINKRITGQTSGATAIVETIDTYYDKGQLITELKLSNEYRSFVNGETIHCQYEEETGVRYLSANLFSGVVVSVNLLDGGSGYTEGVSVPVEGDGTGAQVIISSTTKGSMSSIGVQAPGAGFRVNDSILIQGGGGTGAAAQVLQVDLSEKYHPNTYTLVGATINLETNTPINNVRYSNLVSSIVNPLNHWVANSMLYYSFANCGPVQACFVTTEGNGYTTTPSMDIQSNTYIRSLGILGRMEIVDGGLNYVIGDEIIFTNPIGCLGVGAKANVSNVAANGRITEVKFRAAEGHQPGGAGYNNNLFPSTTVQTSTGNGANIIVTAILGDNESLVSSSMAFGKILELKLVSGGSGYTTEPTINLASLTTGTGAQASATIVTGAFTYPGRFLNDDGFLSGYNFIQDRDYYQNYSYAVLIDEPLNKYKKTLTDLTHPAGMKLFGHYLLKDQVATNVEMSAANNSTNNKLLLSSYTINTSDIIKTGTYNVNTLPTSYTPRIVAGSYNIKSVATASFTSSETNLIINNLDHGLRKNDTVYLKFHTAQFSNVTNGLYTISSANQLQFIVPIANGNTSFYSPDAVSSNLTLSTGSGTTNAFTILSGNLGTSNISIAVGDTIIYGSNSATVLTANDISPNLYVSPPFAGGLSGEKFSVRKKPYNVYGNVSILDPVITITANSTGLVPNDNVYLKFSSNDTSLQNTRYQVLAANASQLRVMHKNIGSAVSFTGNANVYFNQILITANNHGLQDGETVFANFTTGDTGNATNKLYSVSGVTQNTFNITTQYPVSAGGVGYTRTANITLNITGHEFETDDNVYVWFRSGDTANISNGIYTVTKRDNNAVYFETANVLTSNGNISVYRNYANVNLTRALHGYSVGNLVNLLVDTGDLENISNGVYRVVSVANTSTYTIKHTGITVSSNLNNLYANNTGDAYVALHK